MGGEIRRADAPVLAVRLWTRHVQARRGRAPKGAGVVRAKKAASTAEGRSWRREAEAGLADAEDRHHDDAAAAAAAAAGRAMLGGERGRAVRRHRGCAVERLSCGPLRLGTSDEISGSLYHTRVSGGLNGRLKMQRPMNPFLTSLSCCAFRDEFNQTGTFSPQNQPAGASQGASRPPPPSLKHQGTDFLDCGWASSLRFCPLSARRLDKSLL